MSFVMGCLEVESFYFNQQNNQRREIVVCCQLISSLTLFICFLNFILFLHEVVVLPSFELNWTCFP